MGVKKANVSSMCFIVFSFSNLKAFPITAKSTALGSPYIFRILRVHVVIAGNLNFTIG